VIDLGTVFQALVYVFQALVIVPVFNFVKIHASDSSIMESAKARDSSVYGALPDNYFQLLKYLQGKQFSVAGTKI
jgi:hypothetical protein